ncbi:MAG TPA: ATP-binding cassette domain-containing protein [Chitinophagales bacterium]|nr:ATP-binding cassette domain-containing protein [Chitinophagales bacterium]
MAIQVEHLTKIFDKQRAVDDISFSVGRGEILGFLGPNGAGKSTTMKMLTGFLPPSSGKIEICGLDITTQTKEVQSKIGYLPESNPLYFDMYVKEFLDFAYQLQVKSAQNKTHRIEQVIEMVGLGKEQHKKIGQLSKGYKQRVGIAQALLHNPEILILDEPTSGLDPNQLADIRQLIRYLGKEKTIIFSTHIMQEVTSVCNQVVIINQGKIVANNSVSELQKQVNPLTKIIVKFEQAIPLEVIENCNAVKSAVAEENNTLFKIESEDTLQTKKSIFDIAVSGNNSILTLQEESLSLENIFRQLTQ